MFHFFENGGWFHRVRSSRCRRKDLRGAFNPAVAIGVWLLGLANGSHLWMYWLSEFLGAGVATVFFLVLNPQRAHESSVASHESAQDQTNQSIFWSLSPESLDQVTILMSDRGLPRNFPPNERIWFAYL